MISSHPAIDEVAVVGEPNSEKREIVKVYIVLNENSILEQEIIDFCKKSLTPYKVPRIIEFKDELPKSIVGKVLKRELKAS